MSSSGAFRFILLALAVRCSHQQQSQDVRRPFAELKYMVHGIIEIFLMTKTLKDLFYRSLSNLPGAARCDWLASRPKLIEVPGCNLRGSPPQLQLYGMRL